MFREGQSGVHSALTQGPLYTTRKVVLSLSGPDKALIFSLAFT